MPRNNLKNNESFFSLNRMRQNPWILTTLFLSVLFVVYFFMTGSSLTGSVVSENVAAENLISFIESQGGTAELISVEQTGSIYTIIVGYQGQEIPVFVTLDGEYIATSLLPLTDSSINSDTTSDSNTGGQEKVEVSVDDDAVLGSADAPVTIIEFSDYQCPFCRKFWTETYPSLKNDYIDSGKVKIIFRDFPLDFHSAAQISAEAAECVREEGGDEAYWKMHDKIFSEQNIIDSGSATGPVQGTVQYGEPELVKWAGELGYEITSCLDSGKYISEVEKDSSDGASYGITGTPGFFVNGIKMEGAQPYSAFKSIIDSELAKAA